MLTFQYRSVCCAVIKSGSLLQPTNMKVLKRHAFTNVISVQTKTMFFDLVTKLKIMNPLTKSVIIHNIP